MARRDRSPLTPAEWKIMKIVWQRKSCAARDVCQAAGDQYGWAVSTTKTTLRRLVDKGHLKTTRVGNSFLYRAVDGALKSLFGAADTLLDNTLQGTVAPLLAYMAQKSDLAPDELAELRSLLDKLSPESEDEP